MLRAFEEPLVFFTIPFALYAVYLVVQLVNPFDIGRWTRRVVVPLALVGSVLAVGSIVVYGVFADRHKGGYRPAHIDHGRIVPGEMQ